MLVIIRLKRLIRNIQIVSDLFVVKTNMKMNNWLCVLAIVYLWPSGCKTNNDDSRIKTENSPSWVVEKYIEAMREEDYREAARYVDNNGVRFLDHLQEIKSASRCSTSELKIDYNLNNRFEGIEIQIVNESIVGDKAFVQLLTRKPCETGFESEMVPLIKDKHLWVIMSGTVGKTTTMMKITP